MSVEWIPGVHCSWAWEAFPAEHWELYVYESGLWEVHAEPHGCVADGRENTVELAKARAVRVYEALR